MEQLGGLDTSFLYFETPTMHMHVVGLMLLDTSAMPGGYRFETIRDLIVERMPKAPAARQVLARVPLGLSRPYWTDDPHLDIDRHLHRVAVPPPADDRALATLVGDIASWPLHRDRPLWEIWVVEGLGPDQVALVAKVHHATIDGVSGANLIGQLLDLEPVVTPRAESDEFRPRPAPSRLTLLGHGLASRAAQPWDLVTLLPCTALRVASTAWRIAREGAGRLSTAAPFSAPRTSFNATITPRRSVAFVDVPMADVKAVKEALGVTVNDVVTALVSGALRRYLDDRGELPDHSLLAAAPVSVHQETKDAAGITRLSVMFSKLATDVKDPLERIRVIAAANAEAKKIQKLVGADTLLRWTEHFSFHALGLGARLYSSLHVSDHHPVVHNLILSNVPGPPVPLYLAGARVTGLYPLGPIMDGAGLNITVMSQEDRLGIGIITCPELIPRVWDLADAVAGALRELRQVTDEEPSSPST